MARKHIKQKALIGVVVVIAALGITLLFNKKSNAPATPLISKAQTSEPAKTEPKAFNKQQYSLDDPASIWVVVNKKRPLSANYEPTDLTAVSTQQMRSEPAAQVKKLIADAAKQGVNLKAISGYRSYTYQTGVYNAYVAKDGQQQADTYSARPGHSEHQTGLAIDLGNSDGSCDLDTCFGDTSGGKWMAAHSQEYGFVIRYASDKTAITGYQYEPWHIRYVGTDLAVQLYTSKQTLEEFFGLPIAANY